MMLREKSMRPVSNCLSIDVESFVEANLENFRVPLDSRDVGKERFEIEANVAAALELLEGAGIKATFFILGRIARDHPEVVKSIAQSGHELACHGYEHIRVYNLRPADFRQALRRAKGAIEDTAGVPVFGFRAPDFSVVANSRWALDVARELGFVYDSSIFPIALHDVYGIAAADPAIHVLPNGLIEWPPATLGVCGFRVPVAGGGYFRLYPVEVTRRAILHLNSLGRPCMFYIHPYEIGPVVPAIERLSRFRRFRHGYNCSRGSQRLRALLRGLRFAPAMAVLSSWTVAAT